MKDMLSGVGSSFEMMNVGLDGDLEERRELGSFLSPFFPPGGGQEVKPNLALLFQLESLEWKGKRTQGRSD